MQLHDKIVDCIARRIRYAGEEADLKQELRVVLWKAEKAYRPATDRGDLEGFLWMCARNAAYHLVHASRRHKRKFTVASVDAPVGDEDGYTMHDTSAAYDSRGHVEELLDGLRKIDNMTSEQLAITRRIAEGVTLREVAEELGVSRQTIKNRELSAGRPKLPSGRERNPIADDVIARWKRGGATKSAIAKEFGIPYPTMLYWTKGL